MGDRFYLYNKKCAYCNKEQEEIYYAPTSNFDTHECEHCKKTNFITFNFNLIKIEDVTYDDVKQGFLSATNVDWSDEDVKRMCEGRLSQIKGELNV